MYRGNHSQTAEVTLTKCDPWRSHVVSIRDWFIANPQSVLQGEPANNKGSHGGCLCCLQACEELCCRSTTRCCAVVRRSRLVSRSGALVCSFRESQHHSTTGVR